MGFPVMLSEYFEALKRIQQGKATRVTNGLRITKDAVALEAGRGKGSIKKSRAVYSELIRAIETAELERAEASPAKTYSLRLEKIKNAAERNRCDLDATTASLVVRLYEIHELKKEVRLLQSKIQVLTEELGKKENKLINLREPT